MAKLYFRYGAMNSAKSLNLLAVAHNYKSQGKKVLLLKPKIDNRFGANTIASRAGVSMEADHLLESGNGLSLLLNPKPDCILVDECQFLSEECVDNLRYITLKYDIPIICYGLRTDFATNLFSGSKRLMELADSIEEIKTTCNKCDKKAIFNMRIRDGHPVKDGAQIELGAEDKYEPVCAKCYHLLLEKI